MTTRHPGGPLQRRVRAAARRERARAEPSGFLAAQRLEPSMEPTPPAAASPHLVAARQLRSLSATRGGAAHLAPVRPLMTGCWNTGDQLGVNPLNSGFENKQSEIVLNRAIGRKFEDFLFDQEGNFLSA